jgi:hypothetical protein
MNNNRLLRAAICRHTLVHGTLLGLAMAAPAVLAQDAQQQTPRNPDFSGGITLGAEHNNNLSVSQLESASGQSDTAATMDANLDMSWQPVARLNAEVGYSYTGSRYQEIDSFDLDMHLLYTDLSYDFSVLTLGANYYYADADLGGDNFLELNQYSLYAGRLFGADWYLRGALNFSRKEFASFGARDADNNGFSVDLYRFFNQGRSSVTLGYAYEDEDTSGPSFVYAADTLRLRLNHRFMLATKEARLQVGYRFHDRDYVNITPIINVPRDDSQRVADARLEVDLAEHVALIARWENGDYESRLPSADFSDNRILLGVRVSF